MLVCDICKCEPGKGPSITTTRVKVCGVHPERYQGEDISTEDEGSRFCFDLCTPCYNNLVSIIAEAVNKFRKGTL